MRPHFPGACATTVALVLAAGSAAAVDPAGARATAGAEAPVATGQDAWSPLASRELDALRGGDSVENSVDILGEVTNNTAENIVSGDNVVRGEALGNAAGINTLIQNSGSNVLIQNGMTINVQFAPPP
jgi:hypothetical protein